jgi:hypothetical protein
MECVPGARRRADALARATLGQMTGPSSAPVGGVAVMAPGIPWGGTGGYPRRKMRIRPGWSIGVPVIRMGRLQPTTGEDVDVDDD